jgi:hypothetical protein
VLDDVTMFADESLVPPDASGTKEVMERAANCRSSITLDYYGRIYETTAFIALEKLIIAGVGAAVVWRGEGGEEPREGAKLS